MKRIPIVLLLFILMGFGNGNPRSDKTPEIKRGTLLLNVQLPALDSFILNGKINLAYVRSTCNFLTDVDITTYNGFLIPLRKKAFTRHIKHLNEILEEDYLRQKPVDNDMREIFCELALFSASLKQKAVSNSKIITRKDKKKMLVDTRRSHKLFQYKNALTDHEANNVDPNNPDADPMDSPYWHSNKSNSEFQFANLARLKKIKPKPDMVVLFDAPSFSGSAPKVETMDLDLDNKWSLKWGDEVHTDVVGSEIFATLGYDVDHPYFYGENKLTLVFDGTREIKNAADLENKIFEIYKVRLKPFISSAGIITKEMADGVPDLQLYIGKQYVRFIKCVIEGRPDRVKRIGSFIPGEFGNENRRELRGALLAHAFIGNWDTREENTLLSLIHVHSDSYHLAEQYRMSAVFSDLGTSFGVVQHVFPPDFKVGLVNEFPWEVANMAGGIVKLNAEINSILPCYQNATYTDLKWMAKKIGAIDSTMLRHMVDDAHWPAPISELFFHKLASRRASILIAFNLPDPNPISFNKYLTIKVDNKFVIKDGKLVVDFEREKNPESFLSAKGRFRNYGN
jgi:hypothetical protein